MDTGNLKSHGKEYLRDKLHKKDVNPNPFHQFGDWLKYAHEQGLPEPGSMVLSTAGNDGQPSSRIVLLKGFNRRGFVFYTNYESRKGRQLHENPLAALLFFWPELERQVRVQGAVSKVPKEQSTQYFNSRPPGSKIGAVISPQSQVIENRDYLERKYTELSACHNEINRPDHWGGYVVKPDLFEFWQGGGNRLHDRIQYRLSDKQWIIERLAP